MDVIVWVIGFTNIIQTHLLFGHAGLFQRLPYLLEGRWRFEALKVLDLRFDRRRENDVPYSTSFLFSLSVNTLPSLPSETSEVLVISLGEVRV